MAKKQQNLPGVFIVLEGADGSGKGTQFRLLTERLKAAGFDVEVFDFPRYDEASSHFVRQYLNGLYGPASSISPYTASMFYALDRYEAAPKIRQAIDSGKVVLSNRYVGSNMAHQGSKFPKFEERRAFFLWADNLEYEVLGIPRPNLNIFLRVPAEISYQLISQKAARSYTKATRDEHEADINHLRESIGAYDLLCELFTKDFKAIECSAENQLKSVADINNLIWEELKPLLPEPRRKGRAVTLKLDDGDKMPKPKAASRIQPPERQSQPVSYFALTQLIALNPSHRIEWKPVGDGVAKLHLKGDSLKQFEKSTKKLIRSRQNLIAELKRKKTKGSLSEIGAWLSPLSSLVDVNLPKDTPLRWPNLDELQRLKPPRVQPYRPVTVEHIASSYGDAAQDEPVKFVWSSYRNEFDILATQAFDLEAANFEELRKQIGNLNYEQKSSSLLKSIESDSLLRQNIIYRFELAASAVTMLEHYKQNRVTGLKLQLPNPRLGYAVPDAVEKAGLAEPYSEIFDLSFELFSLLEANKPQLAPYGLLLGHRLRWQLTIDLEQLRQNRYDPMFKLMIDKLNEINPLIAAWLNPTAKK